MGAAAAEHEDQAGDGGPLLHFPSTVSPCCQPRGDSSESHHGGAQELADRAA